MKGMIDSRYKPRKAMISSFKGDHAGLSGDFQLNHLILELNGHLRESVRQVLKNDNRVRWMIA